MIFSVKLPCEFEDPTIAPSLFANSRIPKCKKETKWKDLSISIKSFDVFFNTFACDYYTLLINAQVFLQLAKFTCGHIEDTCAIILIKVYIFY